MGAQQHRPALSGRAASPAATRREWPLPLLVGSVLLASYAWGAPRGVVLEDDGLFAMAAWFDGIAHPPGYPLYTWLGHLAMQLPFGSPVWRLHLLSGVAGALACVVLWYVVRRLVPSPVVATAAALAYGYSAAFWSQALVAEVYTLNVLLCLLLLRLALGRDGHAGAGFLAGLLYGLGLSNHWPLLLLFTPALVWLAAWHRPRPRVVLAAAVGLACGLLPYARLVVRSRAAPEVSYPGPVHDLDGFLALLGRSAFRVVDVDPAATADDRWAFLGFQSVELATQFGVVGLLLAALGASALRRRPRVLGALLLALAGGTLPLLLLLARQFDYLNALVYRAYPLPAYAALAILLGCGLHALRERAARLPDRRVAGALRAALPLLAVLAPLLAHAGANLRAADDWAVRFARTLLEALPSGALLLTADDLDTFPVGYLHLVEGVRPDVTLRTQDGSVFMPPLFDPQRTSATRRAEVHARLAAEARHPVCYVERPPHAGTPPGEVDYGLVRCYAGTVPEGRVEPRLRGDLFARYEALLATPERDPWVRMARLATAAHLVPLLSAVLAGHGTSDGVPAARIAALLERAAAGPPGLLALLEARRVLGRPLPPERVLALLDSLGTPFAGAYHTRLQVALRVARGEALLALRRVEEAEAVLREAVALYPSPESPAVQRLAAAYRARGAAAGLAELRAAYPSPGAAAGAVGR